MLDEPLLRRAKRAGVSDRQLAALRPEFAGEDGVRTLRHRLGIRPVYKTVDTCAAEFAARTPYHYCAYETDPAAESEIAPQPERPEGADPGLRAEPDRPGHRVRLLVRARGDGAARAAGVRDRDGQLQPGDRLHRLRHRGPALLRAADLRGRARGRARRAGVRDGRRGDRAARRADAAGARRSGSPTPGSRSWAPPRRRSTWPRTAARSARCCARPACPRPRSAPRRRSTTRRRSPSGSATRCWCGRPTCSAGAAWRSSTTTPRWPATSPGPPRSARSTRCWSTGSSTTRSRSTSTPCATAARSSSAA